MKLFAYQISNISYIDRECKISYKYFYTWIDILEDEMEKKRGSEILSTENGRFGIGSFREVKELAWILRQTSLRKP